MGVTLRVINRDMREIIELELTEEIQKQIDDMDHIFLPYKNDKSVDNCFYIFDAEIAVREDKEYDHHENLTTFIINVVEMYLVGYGGTVILWSS